MALTVSERALEQDMQLTIDPIAAPWPAVAAWDFGPDGLTFAEPSTLEVDYSSLTLPPGMEAGSLQLALYVDGDWVVLDDSSNDPLEQTVTASIHHFSIYGLVASADEVSGWDDSWTVNGITAATTSDRFARLRVSGTFVGLYLSEGTQSSVTLSLSGLPTTGTHAIYADGVAGLSTLVAADNGSKNIVLDGTREHYIWIQPADHKPIYRIGGSSDQCSTIGTRSGDVCTLTGDVEGSLVVEAPDQVLDCDGYDVTQGSGGLGTGLGVLVSTPPGGTLVTDVIVERCNIGGAGSEFAIGAAVVGGERNVLRELRVEENETQIHVMSGEDHEVLGNTVASTATSGVAIRVTEAARGVTLMANDVYTTSRDAGIQLDGRVDSVGVDPVTLGDLATNVIDAADGAAIWLARTGNTTLHYNDLTAAVGLVYGADVASLSVFWNNIEATDVGVFVIPTIEVDVSDGDEYGNWWGRECAGSLFVAGVDSNRTAVVDPYPYAFRDAWEAYAEPGCDSTAPSAPYVDVPIDNAVILSATPTFSGRTEAHASIVVRNGMSVVATGTADGDGNFALEGPVLAEDDYTFTVAAVDPFGNESTATSRSFEVFFVDEQDYIKDSTDSLYIVGVSDSPDPFLASEESNALELVLDIVVLPQPRAGSHFALSERNILDPVTRSSITKVYAATAFDPANPTNGVVRATVSDLWDGTDGSEVLLGDGRAYPYEVTVLTARIPTTAQCEQDETLHEFSFDEVQVVEPIINAPSWWTNYPICCIASLSELANDLQRAGTLDPSTLSFAEWDKATDCATTCIEAYSACSCTGFTQSRCQPCMDKCTGNMMNENTTYTWEQSMDGQICNYWAFLNNDTEAKPPQPCIVHPSEQ